jgi:AcrR family transcriptional regulator
MPKIVDHAERREQLADAVLAVIQRSGLSHVTLREVAREVGWTGGVLLHYFRDKDELLTFAFRLARQRAGQRVQARLPGRSGIEALRTYIEEALPIDDARHLNATIWQAFEGHVAGVPELAEQQRSAYEELHQTLKGQVERAQSEGQIPAGLDPDRAAANIVSTIFGLRTMALINPQHYTPEFMLAVADDVLARLANAPRHPCAPADEAVAS